MSKSIAISPAVKQVQDLLKQGKSQIEAALPKHLSPDRMARIALTTLRQNPKLQECDPYSFLGAVIESSQLGLEVGRQAHLVPFRNNKKGITEVQLIPDYKGYLDLAERAGTHMTPRAVFENDEFSYHYGLEENLVHKPARSDRGELTHAYVVIRRKDGSKTFFVMTREDIEEIRSKSRGRNSGPWVDHYVAMALKTVIRHAFKYVRSSPEMEQALGLEERVDLGESQNNDVYIQRQDGSFVQETAADRLSKKLHQTEEKEIQSEDVQVDPQGEFANYTEPRE